MNSQVLYRKWRSRSFRELVGQDHVARTLKNAVAQGRVAHAYLFCGPRGTGKTSTGRIFAKAVNCLAPVDGDPCNACGPCVSINEGRCVDLIEIDAASNRRIEDVRDLREKIGFAPVETRYKVYIIDEAHMVTREAFNALLKTLEEPPPHAILVLATTDIEKLPVTILSRCQRLDFRRIPVAAMVRRLEEVCAGEGIEAEPAALEAIARSAGGSLRDAENLLDQLVVQLGPRVTHEGMRQAFGLGSDEQVTALVRAALRGDVAAGLDVIAAVAAEGVDLAQFRGQVAAQLRAALRARLGAAATPEVGAEGAREVAALAQAVPVPRLTAMVRAFSRLDRGLDGQQQLALELALVESTLDQLAEAGAPATESAAPPVIAAPAPVRVAPAAASVSPPSTPTEPAPAGAAQAAEGSTSAVGSSVEPLPPTPALAGAATPSAVAPAETADGPLSVDLLRARWRPILNELKRKSSQASGLLNSLSGLAVEGDTIIVTFPSKWHAEQLNKPQYRAVAESVIGGQLGRKVALRAIVGNGRSEAVLRETAEEDLLVRTAKEELGAVVKKVERL